MSEHTEQLAPLSDRRPPERPSHRDDSLIHMVRGVGGGGDPAQHLRGYWEILRKRRWTVLTVTFVVTTLAALVSFRTQPIYEATARIEIEAETPEIQSLNALFQSQANSVEDTFLQTQVRVLQSDNLAWQTIQELGLAKSAEAALPPGRDAQGTATSSTALQTELTGAFKSHLRVQLIRDTRMLEITFQEPDPKLAAREANALVKAYEEYNFHKKFDATRQASGWLEQQLDELKAKVEKSQQALVDYEREHAIVSTSDKESVVEQRLDELSKDLTEALSVRLQKESLYDLVKTDPAQVVYVTQDEVLQRLDEKFVDLRGQYVDALAQYGPNYPKVVRLRDQLNEIQSLIDRQRKRIVTRIKDDYTAAVQREKMLTAVVAQQKAEVGALNQLLIQHNMLKRDFDTNQQLYDNLLKQLKDATVSAGLRATNIHPVDTALPPLGPIRPQKAHDTMVGLLVGLILGVTLAFVREGLDNSIKSADDVERLTSSPVLAIIPASFSLRLTKGWLGTRKERQKEVEASQVELAVVRDPGSALAEAYRSLRTSILLSTAPQPPQALLVTSSQPGEGKTVTTMNLALALAQRGGKVIVVDSDLRKAAVGLSLGLDERKGLSSLLTGAHSLDEVIQKVEAVPNLWALPAGPRPPNPAELLSSIAMEKLIRDLRERYDHIVMDSPPLLLVTDGTVLSNLVDGVMLVVENEGATRGALARSRRILQGANARILGTILNKVDLRRDGYYGQYYRRYYYYYR